MFLSILLLSVATPNKVEKNGTSETIGSIMVETLQHNEDQKILSIEATGIQTIIIK